MKTISDLIRLLQPQPGRFEFATRLGVICALTVLVAEIYQTPEPALTTYIVFFLNRENRTASLISDVALVVVLTAIIGIVFLVAMVVIDDAMWRFVSIALLSFGLLFLASASKLRPIASTVALIAGYGLDELGMIQLGEEGTRALLYAWLFVGIPAGVSIIVNLLMAPAPRRLAQEGIALRLELSAAMLGTPDDRIRDRFRHCSGEGAIEVQSLLKLASAEKTSRLEDIEALRQAADSTVVLMSAIDVMDRNPEASLSGSWREAVARTLEQMASILRSGGYPVEIAWPVPDGVHLSEPLAATVLAEIKHAVVGFTERPSSVVPVQEPSKKGHGFFVEDAFSNPEHIHYALKTTGAAMFCYVLYSLLDWPGIHTAFITCYIVSLATAAETIEKLMLRILGCLIGAGVGTAAIVFLVPALTSIASLMAVVFLGAYAAAYVVGGGPRISYAGFQIAFAFFLCVVQGSAPAFDLSIARDRVVGILIGNLVVYLLFTNLWPISMGKRIDPAIASLLQRLAAMMTAPDRWARRALASQAQSALSAIEVDIDLAGYEPGTVRPTEDWLASRRAAAEEIGVLASQLLLSAGQDAAASAYIGKRLENLAGRFRTPTVYLHNQGENPQAKWNALPLFSIVEAGLRRLEEVPTRQPAQAADGTAWVGLTG